MRHGANGLIVERELADIIPMHPRITRAKRIFFKQFNPGVITENETLTDRVLKDDRTELGEG